MKQDRDKLTALTVNLGLACNVILAFLKGVVGILGKSPALLADGVNSSSDVVYYIAVKIFMKQAKKPADSEHPFGHRQLESIAAIVVGAFILTTGVAIIWGSINQVYGILSGEKSAVNASVWALVIAIATFMVKIFLYYHAKNAAQRTHNPTLKALANDHLNDIMASVAVILGVVLGRSGYYWMDPAAGAIVAIYIAKTGIEIIMESSGELMDSVPDEEFARDLRDISMLVKGVRGIEDIGIHRFGPYYTLNITISVCGSLSIEEAHEISHQVERQLLAHFENGLRKVHIHYHPFVSERAKL